MQRAEHQVAGERRLDGDVGHLAVTDLTHQDDVRRLAQHALERRAEGQPDVLADLHLVDAVEVVFDRVLGGDDLAVRRVEDVERRVQRGGLARAGGAGHQEDAVGTADDPVEDVERVLLETEVEETDAHAVGAQDAQHHALAVVRRAGAHAEVDVGAVHAELDASVLRDALLGDVHAGHQLEAREDGVLQLLRQLLHHLAGAVDPVAQQDVRLGGLDVDVRGTAVHGLDDDPRGHLDDRAFVVDVDGLVDGAVHGSVDALVDRLVDGIGDDLLARAVGLLAVDVRLDLATGGDARLLEVADAEAQDLEPVEVHRVVDHQLELAAAAGHRQHQVLLDQVRRHQGLVDLVHVLEPVEVQERHAELVCKRLGNVLVLAIPGLDQGLAEALATSTGRGIGSVHLLLGDKAPFNEDLAELLTDLACQTGPPDAPRPAVPSPLPRGVHRGLHLFAPDGRCSCVRPSKARPRIIPWGPRLRSMRLPRHARNARDREYGHPTPERPRTSPRIPLGWQRSPAAGAGGRRTHA